MVDYAKFDHIGDDLSDDDEAANRRRVPQVTRLEGPSRVTFGRGGEVRAVVNAPDPSAAATAPPPPPPGPSFGTDYAKYDRMAAAMSDSDDEREWNDE
eukprot:CAMPEP_0197577252 /NCGR_PEP_ID=MMETSP1326-20131121/1958_1 /TAXON_ID=1155430 /ORGANISM="Genus nov. species nov., Strain RCC2288" /LENGTH=97 /DNA_ID=CAMNT_0043140301 /DNA_START=30 /DNA_END=320 /DNA_ORIENTATION=+